MPNIVDTFTEYTQPRYLPSLEQWHCIRNALLCLFSVLSLEEFIELGNGIEVPVLCYLSSFLGPDKRKVSNSFREVGRSINFMHFPVVFLLPHLHFHCYSLYARTSIHLVVRVTFETP